MNTTSRRFKFTLRKQNQRHHIYTVIFLRDIRLTEAELDCTHHADGSVETNLVWKMLHVFTKLRIKEEYCVCDGARPDGEGSLH